MTTNLVKLNNSEQLNNYTDKLIQNDTTKLKIKTINNNKRKRRKRRSTPMPQIHKINSIEEEIDKNADIINYLDGNEINNNYSYNNVNGISGIKDKFEINYPHFHVTYWMFYPYSQVCLFIHFIINCLVRYKIQTYNI